MSFFHFRGQGGPQARPVCERSDKLLMLTETINNPNNVTDGTNANWYEMSSISLKQPKSSATLLVVPKFYAKFCQVKP